MMVNSNWLIRVIKNFTESPANNLGKGRGEPAWGVPLVQFSNGADPLYDFYQKDIGEFYLSPIEFLSKKYPDSGFDSKDLTVISWILPQTNATKTDHRVETHFPSERWARSRIFGEEFNNKLRKHVVNSLVEEGIEAVAPMLSPLWGRRTSDKYGYASTWSERHAAYAAGLGTFGLSDGLITPIGKAMRTGSVVANIYLKPSKRLYNSHTAYCLFYEKNTCGKCIERCPIGAITEAGHDKVTCSKYVKMTREYVKKHYGFEGYGCGLCQTDIPCESGIPKQLKIQ
jgi:hypothetical protein